MGDRRFPAMLVGMPVEEGVNALMTHAFAQVQTIWPPTIALPDPR